MHRDLKPENIMVVMRQESNNAQFPADISH
jgi:serine/threonine protein kinase